MYTIPELAFSPGTESAICALVKSKGLVKITGLVNSDELVELNGEFEEILASTAACVRDLGVEGGEARDLTRHSSSDDLFPATINFFNQAWMQRVSDIYWGDERVLNDHIFVSREISGTKHLAQDLHFDVQETLKFFLYLNDVTRENGAFSCVPGSIGHTRKVREGSGSELSYENREYSRQHPFPEEQIVPVEGPAGTLIIFTTELWHRAGLVSSGERHVMRGHTRTPIGGKPKKKKVRDEARKKEPAKKKEGWIQRLFKR